MQIFNAPTVFGFYLAEYIPPGRLSKAQLTSPEAMLQTAPKMISYLNGMASLIDHGLHSTDYGFGESARLFPARSYRWYEKSATSDGLLQYKPTSWSNGQSGAAAYENYQKVLSTTCGACPYPYGNNQQNSWVVEEIGWDWWDAGKGAVRASPG